jgi:NAD dependent epimerase/dehydratase family
MMSERPPAFTDAAFIDTDSTTPLRNDMVGAEQYTVDEPRPVVSQPAPFSGKVFVAGATGFVGSQVCQQLLNLGAGVVGLSRQGAPLTEERWQTQVEWIRGSALDPASYERYYAANRSCNSTFVF